MHAPHLPLPPDAIYPFDARGVAKRFRHAAKREPGAIVIGFVRAG